MHRQELKTSILQALDANDINAIVSLPGKRRDVLSSLIRMAYDKDTLVGWRAIKAAGLIARALVKSDPEFLRETCRRLLWSLSDESGSIGWAAPELLGEIVSADPRKFPDIIPLIASVYDAEEDTFRPGVLYAIAKIGMAAPELVLRHADVVRRGLSDQNPLTRAFALRALLNIHQVLEGPLLDEIKKSVQAIIHDRAETWVYEGDDFVTIDIGSLAKEVFDAFRKM